MCSSTFRQEDMLLCHHFEPISYSQYRFQDSLGNNAVVLEVSKIEEEWRPLALIFPGVFLASQNTKGCC